jgi:hypothetical protein
LTILNTVLSFLAVAASGSNPLIVRLGDGSDVYLSYVSDALKKTWRPDGKPVTLLMSKRVVGDITYLSPKQGQLEISISLKLLHQPKDLVYWDGSRYGWLPSVVVASPIAGAPVQISAMSHVLGRNFWECDRIVPKPLKKRRFSVELRVADTAWETIDKAVCLRGKKLSGGKFILSACPVPGKVRKGQSPIMVFPYSIPTRLALKDIRLMAFDSRGSVLGTGGGSKVSGVASSGYASFLGKYLKVSRIELQVRPFKLVKFNGIHSEPTK